MRHAVAPVFLSWACSFLLQLETYSAEFCRSVPGFPLCRACMLVLALARSRPAHRAYIHRACIHHMSTAPAPLPDNSIKELVGDAATTESLLACKIGGCCGKDTPLLPLPVSDPFCPPPSLKECTTAATSLSCVSALRRRYMTGCRPSHSGDSPATRP